MQIKEILGLKADGQNITVKGWVRTRRGQANLSFVNLNDGSTIQNLQIVADAAAISEEIIQKR